VSAAAAVANHLSAIELLTLAPRCCDDSGRHSSVAFIELIGSRGGLRRNNLEWFLKYLGIGNDFPVWGGGIQSGFDGSRFLARLLQSPSSVIA
jgi:hypothetical protein